MNGNTSWRTSGGGAARRLCDRASGRRRKRPSATSRSIRQPLALGANKGAIGTGQVINPECDPVVVAEIELGRVAMQVSFGDVEIATVDAALENREEVFNGVGMPEMGADILLRRMIDRAVAAELTADRPIDRRIVGHQVGSLVDIRDDDRLQGLRGHVFYREAADAAVALNQRQHRGLGRIPQLGLRRQVDQ
jgi:hypothetical protein